MQDWLKQIANAELADHKGYNGSARYWLDLDETRERVRETFQESSSDQFSDRMKDIKDSQLNALRRFALTSAASHDHEFFHGKVTEGHGDLDVVARVRGAATAEEEDEESDIDTDALDAKALHC